MSLPYEYRDIKDELTKLNEQLDIIRWTDDKNIGET